jgi:hypothetical protein
MVALVLCLLLALGLLAVGALVAVIAILRQPPPDGPREAPRPASSTTTSPAAAAAAAATSPAGPIPPIPAFPSPAHRLKPGVYMFGQLWRWDGSRWSAEIGDDCEPVMAIFDTPLLGTCAVTWDSVHRRTSPGGAWTREYRSPNGRPRMGTGWGHPVRGLYAGGGSGTLLHSRGDGVWSRLALPDALRTVITAIWGDDDALYLGTADGRVARSAWGSSGEWQITQTPVKDFLFEGLSTANGHYAVAQSGEVLFLPRASGPTAPAWQVEKKLTGAAKGLFADTAGRVWVTGREGVFRSDSPGSWVKEASAPQVGVNAIASNGAVTWCGGDRSILQRRDAGGNWAATAPGRSGTIGCLWVGPGHELLVGTEFMIDVAEGGKGTESEVIASASVAL